MNKTLNRNYLITLFIVVVVNFIFSTHFITLFLIGVVFKIFLEVLQKEEYYSLIAVVVTFLCIEVTQGFYLFSLTLIAIVVYYFVLTKIRHILSSPVFAEFIYIFVFYMAVFVLHNIKEGITFNQVLIFIYNFFIDSIIIGLFL